MMIVCLAGISVLSVPVGKVIALGVPLSIVVLKPLSQESLSDAAS